MNVYNHNKNGRQMLNRQIIQLNSELMQGDVYWMRIVSSDRETLLTTNTKHSFYELHYMIKGDIQFQIDSKLLFQVPEGGFLLIPPGRYHRITDYRPPCLKLVVGFSLKALTPELSALLPLFQQLQVFQHIEEIDLLVRLIRINSYERSSYSAKIISNLLQSLFLVLCRQLDQTLEKNGENLKFDRYENYITLIEEYIKTHGCAQLNVSRLSEYLGISSRHLQRICKLTVNKTPYEIIRSAKLEQIKTLIASADLKISDLAEAVGFSDEYALNRFFKNNEGYSIGKYKKYIKM